jgi:hypothetical protein
MTELDELTEQLRITQGQLDHWVREAFRLAENGGWSPFGTHVSQPEMIRHLEFDGDQDGLPMWERPITAACPDDQHSAEPTKGTSL